MYLLIYTCTYILYVCVHMQVLSLYVCVHMQVLSLYVCVTFLDYCVVYVETCIRPSTVLLIVLLNSSVLLYSLRSA